MVVKNDLGIEYYPVLSSGQNPDEIKVEYGAADRIPVNVELVLEARCKDATISQ